MIDAEATQPEGRRAPAVPTRGRKRRRAQAEVGLATRGILYTVLILFTAATIYPLVWLLLSSFKSSREFQLDRLGWPTAWHFENYVGAWELGGFTQLFINSVVYVGVATTVTILLALAAGFAFAKLRSRATPILYGSFIMGILLTIQAILVPLFLVTSKVGLYNTRWAVLIVYVGVGMPIAVYLCTQYIQSIPDALIESARIDGAGYWTIFGSIIMPMARPVVITLAILNVQGLWNEFILISILVSQKKLQSLPAGILSFSGSIGTDFGKQFAALVIGLVPMLVFYLIFQKQITRGVAAGAMKG